MRELPCQLALNPPLWSHLLFTPLWPEAGGSLESDPNVVCVPTVPAVVRENCQHV